MKEMNMGVLDEMAERFTPVIVKVNQVGYVPDGMSVRARMSEFIFTADCESVVALRLAKQDPKVVSVSVSSRV